MNMIFRKEPKPVFMLENKNVEQIKDPRVLGVYTVMMMLAEKKITKGVDIVRMIGEQFNLSDVEVTDCLDVIHDLGFFGMKE